MDKQLTKEQVRVILQNAPANMDKGKIVRSLIDQGFQLEGFQQENPQQSGIVKNIQEAITNPLKVIPERLKELTPTHIVSQQQDGTYVGNRQEADKAINTALSFTPGGLEKAASGITEPIVSGIKSAASSVETKLAEPTQTTAQNSGFIEKLITPQLTKGTMESAIKTGRVTEGTGLTGNREFTNAIPGIEKIVTAVKSVPGISPNNTLLENSNLIHDEIGKVAESLRSQLKDKGFFSPNEFSGYMKSVSSELKDNPILVGDAQKVADKIVKKFNTLVKENGYTPDGLLSARQQLDRWMSSQKGSGVFDPQKESAVSIALRAIRQGGNKFLADRVPDVEVLKLLDHQSKLYQAIENIAPKAAGEGINSFQRFVKANPKLVKALKFGATAAGGGAIVGAISQ